MKRICPKLRPGIGCLLGLWLAANPVAAQPRFAETVAVREVQVPVRVLVRGKPLAGLTIDDFEIYDRGIRQTITALEVRHLGRAPEAALPGAAPPLTVGAAPNRVGRSLLVLFDLGFSRLRHLGQGVAAIREMLAGQLQTGDRVAIATWGPISGLNLLVGFTADRTTLALALDAVQAMLDTDRREQAAALGELHERRFSSSAASSTGSTYGVLAAEIGPIAALTVLTGPVEYREEEDAGVVRLEQEGLLGPIQLRVEVDVTQPIDVQQDYVGETLDDGMVRVLGLSLAELAALLANVGGQKDVLLLSEGFGGALLEGARSLAFLEKSFRAFRDGGWTLHAIDVGGIPAAEEEGFASNSLLFMAEATGGELAENFSRLADATARILERTEIVYLLSFEPTDEGFAGDVNKLDVRLKEPPRRARIVHRPGYYAPRPHSTRESYEQRVDVAEWLLSNLELTEVDARVTAETALGPQGGGATTVTVEVTAPSLLAVRNKRKGEFELWLAALDRDGTVRDVLTASARVKFRSLEKQADFAGIRFVGDLAPGDYELRVLLRHDKGGEIFLGSHQVTAPTLPAEPPAPAASAADEPGGEWLIVTMERRSAYFR